MLLPPENPLAASLERNRDRFNARFEYARRLHRHIEPEAFMGHLLARVEPVVRAVAEHRPDSADPVTEVLYDLSLELFARGVLGLEAVPHWVELVFQDTLPKIPELLAENPRTVVSALCNAACNLSMEPGFDPQPWLTAMLEIAPECVDAATFLEAGKVLAWRCGLAHFREGALAVWRTLPENLRRATLGFPEDWPEERLEEFSQDMDDPWCPPGRTVEEGRQVLSLVGRLGGFRGFGGPFVSPPEVIVAQGRIFAFDNESCWSVHADCFGATLQRFGRDLPDGDWGDHQDVALDANGTVTWGELSARFALLAGHHSWASDGTTLAVTTRRSHKVFLVARVPGPT